ncbi:MAG: STAS domain-containing protein [Desulfomonilia bacterium]|uniref:Anti-sigma factor antagonist n=1 Tax=anaerobic digester metagenome TaxID=1263854 RepID=A0A485M633_9ZZZZ|nr:STAS domain-containing protein [Pseudomonadota bacterium]HON38502.1 STAS domain-containing protein [Deltaproteobacteria bacterium]HRS54876.1 STAS domain-containing protein [Desulfomonilia bacterium]HPD20152.1 STAS domain-containing protein [Deltaproteobacteria bacterium]HPX17938.1 STAS domain-containing protein [Deltaproteobacteria bacterium]
MKLLTENIDGIVVISSLPKVLDASNAMEFKEGVFKIIEQSSQAVFDMSAVQFIDSAGCGSLITTLRRLKEAGGTLKLCDVPKQVRSVLELVRMHKIIDIYNTREEALRSFTVEH